MSALHPLRLRAALVQPARIRGAMFDRGLRLAPPDTDVEGLDVIFPSSGTPDRGRAFAVRADGPELLEIPRPFLAVEFDVPLGRPGVAADVGAMLGVERLRRLHAFDRERRSSDGTMTMTWTVTPLLSSLTARRPVRGCVR